LRRSPCPKEKPRPFKKFSAQSHKAGFVVVPGQRLSRFGAFTALGNALLAPLVEKAFVFNVCRTITYTITGFSAIALPIDQGDATVSSAAVFVFFTGIAGFGDLDALALYAFVSIRAGLPFAGIFAVADTGKTDLVIGDDRLGADKPRRALAVAFTLFQATPTIFEPL